MACDAHVHPKDLFEREGNAETFRRALGIAAAASSWNREEFAFNRNLAETARREGAPPLFLCFALHPQAVKADTARLAAVEADKALEALEEYAAAGELAAIGETGVDLYGGFRETEAGQEAVFDAQLDAALRHGLPVVLHLRRAMNAVFFRTKALRRLPAVVFHSWPGSPDEGFSLLRRGINAFFSFGTPILLNHKNVIRSCAAFPAERLLVETDAPWQPLRGQAFSRWTDLAAVLRAAGDIRKAAGENSGELERISGENFYRVFGGPAYW